ncbi:isocitrate lyase/PEP mutase family protein [Amycolatopsis anabasis]|uniref:isocitrate lyase/PEP mutase family protein n=1 Tax=Amycolatopsis anabasis TaxID=1840409 RepID=UPI00131BC1A4|nr:isocitrate lyase/phosphoenolpyruvate mutase family protein [Amycolatopsis anabasis]
MTAAKLRELQVPGKPLVLPNAWDADSARQIEAAGFPALATTSYAVAEVLGYRDGEDAPAGEMIAASARIARSVSIPVSMDAEAGYGLPATELADRLLDAGVVGCNLEDKPPSGLRPIAEQAGYLAAVRQAAGDDLVINARVDVFLDAEDPAAVLPEAIERAKAYLDAGADSVFPIFLRSTELLASFVEAVRPAAVAALYVPGGPDLDELTKLGVARISFGGGLWRVARSAVEEKLAALAEGRTPY